MTLRIRIDQFLPVLVAAIILGLPFAGQARSGLAAAPTALQSFATIGTGTAVVASHTPVGTGTVTVTSSPAPVAETTPQGNYVVLLVVDGNRASAYDLTKLPHIQALMNRGTVYDRAFVGELESSTPNVHVSIGTGTLPRQNGFLGFGWATPQRQQTVDFRSLIENGQIDRVLQSLPTPTITERLHEFFPHSVSIAASGHKDYAVVGLGGGHADYELYGAFGNGHITPSSVFGHTPAPLTAAQRKALTWKTPLPIGMENEFAVRYSLAVARKVRPRLLMINLPETDTWGHWYGPDNKKIFSGLMAGVDREVGEIEDAYRQMGILDKTDFIITADHGMMESYPAHSWPDVAKAAIAAGTHVMRGDTEGGAVWLRDPSKAKDTAERLVGMAPAHVEAIFYRSSLQPDYHFVLASPTHWLISSKVADALTNLVDTTGGANGPDLWVLYRENYTVVPRNVSGVWKGTHGGSSWKVQHIPLILSGPGIRAHVHSEFPARPIDLTPTIERLLGLPPIKYDGVTLGDALTDPTHAEILAQDDASTGLDAEVTALEAQSSYDDHLPAPHWRARTTPIIKCSVDKSGKRTCVIPGASPTNG